MALQIQGSFHAWLTMQTPQRYLFLGVRSARQAFCSCSDNSLTYSKLHCRPGSMYPSKKRERERRNQIAQQQLDAARKEERQLKEAERQREREERQRAKLREIWDQLPNADLETMHKLACGSPSAHTLITAASFDIYQAAARYAALHSPLHSDQVSVLEVLHLRYVTRLLALEWQKPSCLLKQA